MATIITSNNYYSGNESLPHTDQLLTAQEAFNKYKSYVIANGGSIMDETECLNDFNFMKEHGILGKVIGVSAKWGVKKNASNVVETLFSPDLSEFIIQDGTAPTYRTDLYAYPIFKFPASSSGTLVQKFAKKNIYSKKIIFALEMKKTSSSLFQLSIGNGILEEDSDVYFSVPYSATGVATYSLMLVDSDKNATGAQKNTEYKSGNVAFYNYLEKYGRMFSKGETASGFREKSDMLDLSDAETSRIYIGKRRLSNSLSGGTTNDEFMESWIINDGTEQIATALSTHIDARY